MGAHKMYFRNHKMRKAQVCPYAGCLEPLANPSPRDGVRFLTVQKFTDRDKQEVQGYFELLQNVFQAGKHGRISENTIKWLGTGSKSAAVIICVC